MQTKPRTRESRVDWTLLLGWLSLAVLCGGFWFVVIRGLTRLLMNAR